MLYPAIAGNLAIANWYFEGGRAVMVGDSITQQVQSAFIQNHPKLESVGGTGTPGAAFVDPAWTDNGAASPTDEKYSLFQSMREIEFNADTAPNQPSWSSQILASGACGLSYGGSGSSAYQMEISSVLRSPYRAMAATANGVRLRVPLLCGPDGVTTEDLRLAVRVNGGTTPTVYSDYFSTVQANESVVWKEVTLPQTTITSGSVSCSVEYKPNAATRAGEFLRVLGAGCLIQTDQSGDGIGILPTGIGGMTTADAIGEGIAARNNAPECYTALLDGFEANTLIIMLGQNGQSPAALYESDIGQLIEAVRTLQPGVKFILASSSGNSTDTGGEVGSMEHVIGAHNLAVANPADVLHLNLQRLLPARAQNHLGWDDDAYANIPASQVIMPGALVTDSGKRYMSKKWNQKSAIGNLASGDWVDTGAWTSGQALEPSFASAQLQFSGDGTHPTFWRGHAMYAMAFHAAHYIAKYGQLGNVRVEDMERKAGTRYENWSDDFARSRS